MEKPIAPKLEFGTTPDIWKEYHDKLREWKAWYKIDTNRKNAREYGKKLTRQRQIVKLRQLIDKYPDIAIQYIANKR